MQAYSASPVEMIASLWRNRDLIRAHTRREIEGRYRGSIMGVVWMFLNPLLMLAVYTFVFSVVFKARWDTGSDSKTEFALLLFAGLMVFNLFSECVTRAPGLVLSNPNYVKKVIFPLETLPFVQLLAALFHGLVSLLVWLLAYLIFFGIPHATVLYVPLIVAPFGLFVLGISWWLASLGVYLRDVSQLVGIVTTITLFLSPIFYPPSALPEGYRALLYFNPLTPVVEQMRDVLYFGLPPSFILLAASWGGALLVAWLGFAWFQKTRRGFADVL